MAEFELDTLVTTFTGDSSEYEAVLKEVRRSNEQFLKDLGDLRKAMQEAFTGDSNIGQVFEQSFTVARESTGQFTREFTQSMDAASQSTEAIFRDIEQLNQQMRDNHAAVREGEQSREQYRQNLEAQRQQLQRLVNEYNRAARGIAQYGGATSEAVSGTDDLDERIKALSNSVRTSRNEWAARITTDEEFRRSTEALHREMWELHRAGGLTGDQMRKLTQDMAYAQRGLDSVNKVASRGGLAWTAQIAAADAFGNTLRSMGPAGNVAASGLRAAQMGFAALVTPINLADFNLKKFATSLGSIAKMLPLLTAAAGTAAVAGLWRMANASSEMATQMEVASQRTGLSIEALQEYQYAAKQAGIEGERFNTVAQRILRRAADARAGNEGLAKAFDQLGVSLTDAEGNLRGIEDLLGQVADGLFRVENQGERVALAFKIMDTEGSQMLNFLSAGSEGIAEMRREARDLGLVISGDTIMSLSEFGNQVSQLQRQFEVARIEVVAAFLPVLQDVLIPLIQQVFVPAVQTAANRISDFADRLTDTGPVGEAFRRDMISNVSALLELGNVALGVVQGVMTAVNAIALLPAYLGGATRGAIDVLLSGVMDDVRAEREELERAIDTMTRDLERMRSGELLGPDGERVSEAALDVYQQQIDARLQRLAELPTNAGEYIQLAAMNASDVFTEAMLSNLVATFETMGRDVSGSLEALVESAFGGLERPAREGAEAAGGVAGEGFVEGFSGGFAGSTRTIADVISDMQNAIGIAAQRAAHNVAVGMDEATAEAIRLGEELTVVTNAYNTLLTGDFDASDSLLMQLRQQAEDLQAALDNLPGAATATAWTSRLQLELELGVKEPQEVIDILTPRLQELIAERDELLEGGAYNTQAFKDLTADIDVLTRTVDAATNMLPEAAEDAGSGVVAAFQRAAAAANEALKGVTSEMTSIFAGVGDFAADNLEFEEAARLARLLGQEFDPLATRLQIVENRIRDLNSRFHELNPLERMWLSNLQAEHAQLQQQQAAVEQYTQRLDALVGALGGFADRVRGTLTEVFSGVGDFAADNLAFEEAERVARALGQEFDELTTRLSINESTIRRLHSNYHNLSATQLMYLANLEAETAELQALLAAREREAEAAELAALRTAKAAAAAEQTTESYESLLATIREFGVEQDPFDQFRAQLKELAATGHLTGEQVAEAIRAITAAQERLDAQHVEELNEQFLTLEESVLRLAGQAPNEFQVLEEAINELIVEFEAAGEEVEHLLALLDLLGQARGASEAEAKAEAFVKTLGDVRSALHQIGSAAGGDIGALITGLGDAVGIAQKFASGDVAGAVADILSEIASTISEIINANQEWLKSLDDLSNRYRSLSREAVEAIAVSRREAIRFLGIPVGSKLVPDEAATSEGFAWATTFVSTVERALKSADPVAELELGIDEMIRDELIRGFTTSAAMTEAIVEIVELFRAAWDEDDPVVRDQLILQARAAAAGMQDEMMEFYAWLEEEFPELYDAGVDAGRDFASGVRSALQGSDFTGDFTRGLQEMVRDSLIDGFLESEDVQSALEAAREAYAAGNAEEARAIMETITSAGEAFWEQLKRDFPDLYEDLQAEEAARAAEELARALQESADAAARLDLEVQQSELARAFETGALGLAAYRDGLIEAARAEADLAREIAHRELAERRANALAGLEGDELARASEQFDREADAIDARWRESLANAEHEAVNAIKSILGVATSSLSSTLRSAFDASTYSEFVQNFEDSMRDTLRGALIAGFLESAAIKPLLDELGNMITDAIVEGTFDAATKAAIAAHIDLITENSEAFFELLDELGFGFKDLSRDTDRLSESIQSATSQMLNVPSLFKFTSATWSAAPVAPGWAGGGFTGAQQSVTNETHFHVNVTADTVIGIDDLDEHIDNTVRTSVNQSTLATAGLGMGRRGDW